MIESTEHRIAVIGLGYVGLPLAVEFSRFFKVTGFDIDETRISDLRHGIDVTLELDTETIKEAKGLFLSSNPLDISTANVYIVTVPTPVDLSKRPDLSALISASELVGSVLKKNDIVIFESTVFPGCTEEICVPVLQKHSGLRFNESFFCGYSPERINPGDKAHRLSTILKVTSGSTPEVAEFIDSLYRRIITAGTYQASSIKVAEAAKVIENTQRDLNIALMNELSLIFGLLDIDTNEVLDAAATKWNFLPFRPGLVGGHCIGVDPYYLTHKSQQLGYYPEVILAGRRINDKMGSVVAERVVKLMLNSGISVLGSRILLLGLSFKEDCPDIRNTKAIDIFHSLGSYSVSVDIYDPWVKPEDARREFDVTCLPHMPHSGKYDAIVIAVGHQHFVKLGADMIRKLGRPGAIVYDVKAIFPLGASDGRL